MRRKAKNIVAPSLKKFNLFILLILAIIAIVGFFWWRVVVLPADPGATASQTFVIKKGENLSLVATRLQEADLIRSSLAFKILILSKDMSDRIQAGSFSLKPSLNIQEIAEALTHGTADIWLTFPEGWRSEEYGERLAANLTEFNYQDWLVLTNDLEGQLFPDTYLLPKQATVSAVVSFLTDNFEKKFVGEFQKAKNNSLTKNQVLTVASLVEREAKKDEDRVIVAGIIIKRWVNDWPLQIDASVQYLAGNENDWWPQITKQDLSIDSPYNTYKNKELPPGPICNPGLSSIRATLFPRTTDYWFYLSDNQGKMHYATTVEEHDGNISRYLR